MAMTTTVCYNLDYDSLKLDCMKAIADQEFSQDSVNLCSELDYDSQKIDCLRRSARPPSPQRCSLVEIQRKIRDSIYELDRDRAYIARDVLRHLDDELSDCIRSVKSVPNLKSSLPSPLN